MEKNNKNSHVELLAPAGDFACFRAAIHAGADAVYLGGNKFGARAYASNFSQEEIIAALREAHILGRKIYLTVNTLVKEKEMPELVPYMQPLYEAGLDGVIVQDLGVLQTLKEHFPNMELHASTQMTITSAYGAQLLKDMGVCRVVPARELSLKEIEHIKEKTGLAIECFIHGAMCYAYSGQCLFSSILGGRSGNRGRCAGPCRLPYKDVNGKSVYPLSLKDMYTLDLIPELIKAGIDSFKIEGRMKSPEYVAGVTSVYRKYIDSYLANPDMPYHIDRKDEEMLKGLYIRSDICHGYYKQHNDKSMVTLKEPGYSGGSPQVLADIKEKYLTGKCTLPIKGAVKVIANQPVSLTLTYHDASVTIHGEQVSPALNRPLDETEIRSRISKMGDTSFSLEELDVETDHQSFLPVKAMNELRRQACMQLEEALLSNTCMEQNRKNAVLQEESEKESLYIENPFKQNILFENNSSLFVGVMTIEQLKEALLFPEIAGIYISADLFSNADVWNLIQNHEGKQLFLSLPHILRERSFPQLNQYRELLDTGRFSGVLIRNHEELQWLMEIDYQGQYIADYMLYTWNKKAVSLYQKLVSRTTVPVELNKKEILQLGCEKEKELLLYGRLPLMYSANCLQKTLGNCLLENTKKQHTYTLTDRYKNHFPVVQNCIHCYNILYNTVPMSLHGQIQSLLQEKFAVYRLDFSIESREETHAVLQYYSTVWKKEDANKFPIADFTNGHYKRGVE